MRDSFVMYRSFYDAVSELDDTDRLAVLDAICKYALDGTEPEQKGTVSGMFKLIRPQIDANNKRYENGRRGGKLEPNPNQSVTKPEPNRNQTVTKPEPNPNQTGGKAEPNVKCNMLNDNDLKDQKHCPADDVVKVVDHLNQKTGAHYLSTSGKTRSLVQARLREGFTVEDFKTVIDKKTTEWKGTDMEKYLRPETLFGTKFEGYLNQKSRAPTNSFTGFDQRNYDYAALEAQLLKGVGG